MDPFCVDQLLRWDRLWNLVGIPSATPVKKTDLLSPSGYQLQMTLWLGMGLCPWFPFSGLGFVWLELVQVLCTLLRCLWAQVWISTVESVRCCFLGVIHNLGLWQSFQRLFCEDGYDSRGRNVTKSSTSHSVHCPLWVSVLVTIYCKKLLSWELTVSWSMGTAVSSAIYCCFYLV